MTTTTLNFEAAHGTGGTAAGAQAPGSAAVGLSATDAEACAPARRFGSGTQLALLAHIRATRTPLNIPIDDAFITARKILARHA